MKQVRVAGLAVLLGTVASAVTALAVEAEPLTFSVTGDGPRGAEDWDLLPAYFALEKADGRSAFLLHVGDICKGHDVLPEAYYARVAELFQRSPVPVVFVPGDNEWNDLEDPDEGWRFWERHFLRFPKHFADGPKVWRQHVRPENVAWIAQGVLIMGINLVGGTVHDAAEWKRRHSQNAAWVRDNLTWYGGRVRAAVVFAQAAPSEKQEDFFAPFVEAAATFGKPLLYLHGDGHAWQHEPQWRAPNVLRVQVDQVSKAPPVLVTVTTDPGQPFVFDRRID
ncbi:MAG: hypothetical protein GWP08_19320 [Nitrospiraceae bacterium]|nr:hypothetical protein [Nitrospiraceae bacterium]